MSEQHDLPEHVQRNRAAWDSAARNYAEPGRQAWQEEPRWGIWGIPETDVHLLPDVTGKDVIELGCGTAYVSAWLARRGARVTGIDNSAEQLKTARKLQEHHGLSFPLIHGNAEQVPLPDASFDLAISEYGACLWCDPYRWIPEAARLLRPGGQLIFLTNGTILMLCAPDDEENPATERLLRDYFGMHRFEWPGEESVEFHLGYGEWIRLLRAHGFEIENLIELQPAPRGHHPLSLCHRRVGAAVAVRGGLDRAQEGMTDVCLSASRLDHTLRYGSSGETWGPAASRAHLAHPRGGVVGQLPAGFDPPGTPRALPRGATTGIAELVQRGGEPGYSPLWIHIMHRVTSKLATLSREEAQHVPSDQRKTRRRLPLHLRARPEKQALAAVAAGRAHPSMGAAVARGGAAPTGRGPHRGGHACSTLRGPL